jgi:hypothetical protein
MATERHRGRPRSREWRGPLGAFVNDYTATRLATVLDADLRQIYDWARGDFNPRLQQAIAISEIARAAGRSLTLEDIYASEVTRVRARMRSLTTL